MKRHNSHIQFLPWRFRFVLLLFFLLIVALVVRMLYLTVLDRSFLLTQGASRYLRTIKIPAYRGMIIDRYGHPLAVSTPVDSIWVNPEDFPATFDNITNLSRTLRLSAMTIKKILRRHAKSQFVYLERNVNPDVANQIKSLAIPGVYLQQAYQRYYPQGEAAAQVIGFTNIDDQGQSGLELAYHQWLSGKPGKERVLKDRYGQLVAILRDISPAEPGHNLTLSLDQRLQYLAYTTLKESILQHHAESGSVVILNPRNGQILAMVNVPSFNPNNRPSRDSGQFRNRAVTDTFEPGSTMKAFSIASALDSGKYTAKSQIDTNPGYLNVGDNVIHDLEKNNGVLTVEQVLQKSSNIGVAKMTLSLPPEHFVDLLRRVGFGTRTNSGFPGEQSGSLVDHTSWRPFELATLAFGYGISITPLQLAQAYSVIANGGLQCPVTFLMTDQAPVCERVMDQKVSYEMLHMLEAVLETGGTGTEARVDGYHIAGKTGTARIASAHGYYQYRHMASFVGIAPVSNPQLVVAVVIRNPIEGYYGGLISAPAFSKIMKGALAALNVPPDNLQNDDGTKK